MTHICFVPVLGLSLCLWGLPTQAQDALDIQFGFQEFDWSDGTTLEYLNTPIGEPGNFWGSEDRPDTYVQTGAMGDAIDAYIPASQSVEPDDVVVLAFDSRFLTNSTNHSYLAFGSDADRTNAVWLGHGGGRFHVGTGTDFDMSTPTPGGVVVEASFDDAQALTNDSRIRVRLGFDVASQTIRNFQVDGDRDGEYEQEFISPGEEISTPSVDPLEWFLITYAGRGESRADDVSVTRQSSNGDYNGDLDFNEEDADILCADGVVGGDLFYDFNGDGQVNIDDVNEFAFEHNSLPGDMDFNGTTEFADFLILSGQFGKPATYSQGDITCNGRADFPDFLILSTFFGSSVGQQQQAQVFNAVPEPDSAYLAIGAIICCVAASRRRR